VESKIVKIVVSYFVRLSMRRYGTKRVKERVRGRDKEKSDEEVELLQVDQVQLFSFCSFNFPEPASS